MNKMELQKKDEIIKKLSAQNQNKEEEKIEEKYVI